MACYACDVGSWSPVAHEPGYEVAGDRGKPFRFRTEEVGIDLDFVILKTEEYGGICHYVSGNTE